MELYAKSYLTETEHEIVSAEIGTYCYLEGLRLHYYRKPEFACRCTMWREFKVSGSKDKVARFEEEHSDVINRVWRDNEPEPSGMGWLDR